LGWLVLSPARFWTMVVGALLFVPFVIATLSDVMGKAPDVAIGRHFAGVRRAAARHGAQALLTLAFLPYEAYFCVDAILRTLWRLLITRRRLLEWDPSSAVDRSLEERTHTNLRAVYRSMAVAPAVAIAASLPLAIGNPAALLFAAPILLLWGVSPAVAWWIGRPIPRRIRELTVEHAQFLRKLARKTWAYFETYVGPDDHWLPPDNYQEGPVEAVAHRTSSGSYSLTVSFPSQVAKSG